MSFNRRLQLLLLATENGGYGFFHRFRGTQESKVDTPYYKARAYSGNAYSAMLLRFTCTGPTSVRVEWGNSDNAGNLLNTQTVTGLPGGVTTDVPFAYTSDWDCLPENMDDTVLANRRAREKFISVYLENPALVSGFEILRSETGRFDERGLLKTQVTGFYAAAQALTNLPPLPATCLSIVYGNGLASTNAITFSAILDATVLCRNTLKILDSSSTNGKDAQLIPRTQHYDLREFPGLETARLGRAQVNKISIGLSNTNLKELNARQYIPGGTTDVAEMAIPPQLETLIVGGGSLDSMRLSQPVALQTAQALTYIDLVSCYAVQFGLSAVAQRDAFYQSIQHLWLGRAGHRPGVKTALLTGNGGTGTDGTTITSAQVNSYIADLTAAGWSVST